MKRSRKIPPARLRNDVRCRTDAVRRCQIQSHIGLCVVLDPEPDPNMITDANRATPKPPTQEEQEDAMTSEGAPPDGQRPDAAPTALTAPATRSTLHLPNSACGAPDSTKV